MWVAERGSVETSEWHVDRNAAEPVRKRLGVPAIVMPALAVRFATLRRPAFGFPTFNVPVPRMTFLASFRAAIGAIGARMRRSAERRRLEAAEVAASFNESNWRDRIGPGRA